MAKTVTISQAEYEYMKTVIAHDGMTIARFEVELAQAREDIRSLLISHSSQHVCKYCACDPAKCTDCEQEAVWRGYRSDANGGKQQAEGRSL